MIELVTMILTTVISDFTFMTVYLVGGEFHFSVTFVFLVVLVVLCRCTVTTGEFSHGSVIDVAKALP